MGMHWVGTLQTAPWALHPVLISSTAFFTDIPPDAAMSELSPASQAAVQKARKKKVSVVQ